MSAARLVVLRTGLFGGRRAPPHLENLSDRLHATEYTVDAAVMSDTDWDRVLEAILDADRCITL